MSKLPKPASAFETTAIALDIEELSEFFERLHKRQMALL
jgi:hypothetical protein